MENVTLTEEDLDSSSLYVAGLAEQIAQAMLQDDDDDDDDDNLQNSGIWSSNVQAHAQRAQNFPEQRSVPVPTQYSTESEAMQLLYNELLRLKMDEMQQLSYYKKSPLLNVSHKGSVPNMVSSCMSGQFYNPKSFHHQQFHVHSISGRDWDSLGETQNYNVQGLRPDHANIRLRRSNDRPAMRATASGMHVSRNSGGTGVFFPRSRAGSHPFHSCGTKEKPVLLPHTIKVLNHNMGYTLMGAASARVSDGGFRKEFPFTLIGDASLSHSVSKDVQEKPSFHHPTFSAMQEVAPNISLPTEWTY